MMTHRTKRGKKGVLLGPCEFCLNMFVLETSEANRRDKPIRFCSRACGTKFRHGDQETINKVEKRRKAAYKKWESELHLSPLGWAKRTLNQLKQRSKRKGIECTISAEDLLPMPEICPLLGIFLNYSKGTGKTGFRDDSPSVDRLINSKGYVPGNVWIISYRANSIKRDSSLEELKTIVECLETATAVFALGKKYQ